MTIGGIGKLIAGLLALLAAGVLMYSFVFAGQTPASSSGATNTPDTQQSDRPGAGPTRSLSGSTTRPNADPPADANADTDQAPADDAVITRVDPQTGELELRLTFAEFTPIDQIRSRILQPRATIYRGDRVIIVSAQQANVITPSRDETPESGTLRGDVVVTVKPAGSADDPTIPADLQLRTDQLRFQTTLGQLETAEPVEVTAAGVTFAGVGLTARGSEQQGRLQYLRIERNIAVTLDPDALEGAAGRDRDNNQRSPTPDEPRPTAASARDPGARIDLYRLALAGGFRLEQGPRSLSADRVDVFARLADGALPAGAIQPIGATPDDDLEASNSPRPSDPDSNADRRTAQARRAGAEPGADITNAPPQPITLTAAGPLEITPLAGVPQELNTDDLFGRVRSPETGRVTLQDAERGLNLAAGAIGYGFASRQLAVRGVGGELGIDLDATLDDGRRLRLLTGALDIDLVAGFGRIPGAGEARLLPAADPAQANPAASLRWIERADVAFRFATDRDGPNALIPTRITATGEIRGRWDRAEVTGQHVEADFVADADTPAHAAAPATDAAAAALRRVSVTGGAVATLAADAPTGDDAAIQAQTINVTFAPLETSPPTDPTNIAADAAPADDSSGAALTVATAEAIGAVRANFGSDELAANRAAIEFVPGSFRLDDVGAPRERPSLDDPALNAAAAPTDPDDDRPSATAIGSGIERFTAEGDASIVTAEGYELDGDTITLADRGDLLELTGTPARAAVFVDDAGRAAGRDFTRGVSVTAGALRLERPDARLVAFGAGSASFAVRNDVLPDPTNRWRLYDRGVVRFAESMIVDDAAGEAEVLGAVEGVFDRLDTLERFEVDAGRATVRFRPGQTVAGANADTAAPADTPTPDDDPDGLSVITAVELEAAPGDPDATAIARLRRFREPTAGRDAQAGPPRIDAGGAEVLVELAAPLITVDTQSQRVTTPNPGALRVVDLRNQQPGPDASPLGVDARGATVFRWDGDFTLDGAQRQAEMFRRVRLAHLPPDAQELVLIECERLIAFAADAQLADVHPGAPPAPSPAPRENAVDPLGRAVTLDRVLATGAVWARQGAIQLVADRIEYARTAGELLAQARRGNRVTIFDADTARHFNAQAITLDLDDGVWRATGAEAVTSPQ